MYKRRFRSHPFVRKLTTSIEHNERTYLAEVTLECTPGSFGKTYGDPYDCYPPEAPMAELVDVEIIDVEDNGDPVWIGKHVDWKVNVENLIEEAFEAQEAEHEAALEDHWERKMDAMREGD